MVRKAVIKQRLEALRDKWYADVHDLMNECSRGSTDMATGIKDCADDLQKEIDLLP